MDAHAKVEYHITAMAKMKEFLARHQNPSQRIDAVLDKEAQKQMEDNQTVVKSLLKVVMLCGKQGLAFRSHRHDKIDWLTLDDDLHQNQGKFLSLFTSEPKQMRLCVHTLNQLTRMNITPQRQFKMN